VFKLTTLSLRAVAAVAIMLQAAAVLVDFVAQLRLLVVAEH
jgi:hypothetical protein